MAGKTLLRPGGKRQLAPGGKTRLGAAGGVCCCDICNCSTCSPVVMPSAFDLLVQGVAVSACTSNLASGIGDPNGQWLLSCRPPSGTGVHECRWDTRIVPVSARIYAQAGCTGGFINYGGSYTSISAINGSGLRIRIAGSTAVAFGDGPAFFDNTNFLGTCLQLRGGLVLPNQTNPLSQDVGFGGTVTVAPHNPLP